MNLVGGIPTPLKNMSSSVGMMIHVYSQYMESHKIPCFQTTNQWIHVWHMLHVWYTLSFYRGSQDGKTIRFTWKSYRSHSWGKRETGLPDQKMNVNHLHGSSLKEHVQHGSWKTETKNAYVEVTWRSKHQVGNFSVNMFSPHVEYVL